MALSQSEGLNIILAQNREDAKCYRTLPSKFQLTSVAHYHLFALSVSIRGVGTLPFCLFWLYPDPASPRPGPRDVLALFGCLFSSGLRTQDSGLRTQDSGPGPVPSGSLELDLLPVHMAVHWCTWPHRCISRRRALQAAERSRRPSCSTIWPAPARGRWVHVVARAVGLWAQNRFFQAFFARQLTLALYYQLTLALYYYPANRNGSDRTEIGRCSELARFVVSVFAQYSTHRDSTIASTRPLFCAVWRRARRVLLPKDARGSGKERGVAVSDSN